MGGVGRDATLDWTELRRRVSISDARLLLRTSALDLAVREKFVVFDLVVLKGYVDRDRCVLLLPSEGVTPDDICRMPSEVQQVERSREHCARVEYNVREALVRLLGV